MSIRRHHRQLAPALLILTSATANADRYHYYRLQTGGWRPHGLPAINNQRETAYLLFDGTAPQLYYTGGNSPYFNYVADTYGAFSAILTWTINDLGSVTFVVQQDDGRIGIYSLFGNESNYRTIFVAAGAQEGLLPLYVSMDEANRVAFATSFYTGIDNTGWNYAYHWAGATAVPLASDQFHPGFRNASIANDGSYIVSGPSQELFGTAGSGLAPIGPMRWITSELNDAGQAAAQTGNSILLYRPADGTQEVLANTLGDFALFQGPIAINNRGQVAFWAGRDDGVRAIFGGPDPQADLVLREGQSIFNRTVSSVAIGRNAINDRGQIAMQVSFSNQTAEIVIADPLAGDINMDCEVLLDDLSILLSNFGNPTFSWFHGDVVQNDRVDLADLALMLSQYGRACP